MNRTKRWLPFTLCAALLCDCASTQKPGAVQPPGETGDQLTVEKGNVQKELPPASAAQREVRFPKIERAMTSSGLELNTVQLTQLPIVEIKLVIRSGSASDPADIPGLAQLTAAMLKEGTTKHNSARLAEAIDFLGASLSVNNDEDRVYIDMQALSEHFEEALALVAEVATKPVFDQDELNKLKKREEARLQLQSQSPRFLADREFNKALYGAHPYAHVDTNLAVLKKLKRQDLAAWHLRNFAPNNAFLVVTGNVSAEVVRQSAEKVFGSWTKRKATAVQFPAPPTRKSREVVIVDRPQSVQSVIYYGNLAIARNDPDYIPLMVANQVLGGSAAARLFMDLREKQSLTYGAYSDVNEHQQVGPFMAYASVRNEVTEQAMTAFNAHLERIATEAPADAELADAKRYLIDRLPLRIDTPDKIADLVAELRTYGLPDDYWDHFGAEISAVTKEAAFAAAQKHIRPKQGMIVVVGEASAVRPALETYGPVTVYDTDGKLVVKPAVPQPVNPPSTTGAKNP